MFLQAFLEGILATAAMTFFVYIIARFTGLQMQVIHILGTMLTGETTSGKMVSHTPKTRWIGTVTHYLIGVLFAIGYEFLWQKNITQPTVSSAFFLGVLIGVLALLVWSTFIRVHPNPPAIPLKWYLSTLFAGHILFSFVVLTIHQLLLA